MKIGLALGGGATRGATHLGVLSVLVEAGIPIHAVSGCSAGSIVGSVFCAGFSIKEMKEMAVHMRWRRIATFNPTRSGLISLDRLERWLVMVLGDIDFSDLDIPLAVVTVDVSTGERIVLKEGRLSKAVHASCTIPGLMNPIQIRERTLMDGGLVDNLPVTAARELGTDFVIGVDIFEPNYGREGGPAVQGLMAIEILVRNAGGGIGLSDYLICPSTGQYSYLRFGHLEELISLGERAARRCLPDLIATIEEYEKSH